MFYKRYTAHRSIDALQAGPDGVQGLRRCLGDRLYRLGRQVGTEVRLQVLLQLVGGGRCSKHVEPLREQPVLHHLYIRNRTSCPELYFISLSAHHVYIPERVSLNTHSKPVHPRAAFVERSLLVHWERASIHTLCLYIQERASFGTLYLQFQGLSLYSPPVIEMVLQIHVTPGIFGMHFTCFSPRDLTFPMGYNI